jgi:hypothetical protein
MTWTAIFVCDDRTITRSFADEPEHREVEDLMNRYGADRVRVAPNPPKENH